MKIEKLKMIQGSVIGTVLLLFVSVPTAFAHVIVNPKQVGVAASQEFIMSVPTEKDNPTIGIRLIIPDELKMVTPNVKAGWTINEVKKGTGDTAAVTEINWSGGSIPAGQRDDFLFQAQVPAKEVTLQWKAYQIYQDGSVVAWDHAPSKDPTDDAAPPPYSTTKVVNDLTVTPVPTMDRANSIQWLMVISEGALALSIIAIGMQLLRRKS